MPLDMSELLREAAIATSDFLNEHLPSLHGENWWHRGVLVYLSDRQSDAVQRNRITDLAGLDLAALLHTLHNNRSALDGLIAFPPGAFNFVQEMRSIRNRWSHSAAGEEPSFDDMYRDLDTLERFLSIINAPEEKVAQVKAQRLSAAREMLKSYSVEVPAATVAAEPKTGESPPAETPGAPLCPVCGNEMVLRTARTGRYAGNQFWGCSEWSVTGCNGIINLSRERDEAQVITPSCPVCQSAMVLRTARTGPHAGNQFWGCIEWGITGCGGLRNLEPDPPIPDVGDLPF